MVGIPVNEMPISIPQRTSRLFASIPEQLQSEDAEEEEEEEERVYEVSDVPKTPEESFLNQVVP